MNKKYFYPLVILPSFVYFSIAQLAIYWRQIIIAITLTILFIGFSGKHKATESFKQAVKYLERGFVLLAVLLILATTFPVGGLLAKHLMLPHANGKADAIVVLAAGSTPTGQPGYSGYQRISHASTLFKANRAKQIIISTGYSRLYGFAEHNWVSSYTSLLELPPENLTILKDASILTTHAEALYLRSHFPQIKNILLVTNGAHIKRSEMVFKKQGFTVLPAPVHNDESVYYANENYLTSLNSTLHEWLGLIYYRCRGWI